MRAQPHPAATRGSSVAFVLVHCLAAAAVAQSDDEASRLRAGRNFLETEEYSQEDDQRILKLFDGLRVADVTDGLDAVGLRDVGRVDASIAPLWRDTKEYSHRFIGIAVTVRYVPTQDPFPSHLDEQAYDAWASRWYGERSSEPFVPLIRPGTAVVIEDAPQANVGSIGSNNIMAWTVRGCVGVVTSATARDTDEIIAQGVPLYYREAGSGIRPGRNEVESVNRPVVVGGALVRPGDVVVADGDGVVIVPRAHAEKVAQYARKILEGDKAARRRLYQRLGLPPDASVE